MSKLSDISSKTLVSLFIVALAITLLGVTISLVKFDKFEIPLITGLTATTAEDTLTTPITQTTAVSFVIVAALLILGIGLLVRRRQREEH